MDRPTYSQTWDRLGPQRPKLRTGVQVHRRIFRRRRGYVLHDPTANAFFRLDPVSYHLLGLLDGTRTVDEAWLLATERFGDGAPTQNEVVGLLGQLYQANLVAFDGGADADQLFKRMQRRQQDKARQQAMNFLFLKIPLFDPAATLDWLLPLLRPLLGGWGLAAWGLLLLTAAAQLAMHGREFRLGIDNLLRPENLPWLAAIFVATKALHEFGHGLMCRRFGGQVHEMGVMLLVFAPVPYCDATSSWALSTRRQRAMVGLAGILVELGVAAIAAILWANTAEGDLHRLAFSTVFITGVASLLFNANPLLRYDGYYVLSDLLDIPNLYQRANRQLLYLVQHHVFALPQVRPVAHGLSEPLWLVLYAAASWSYRLAVFTGIFWALSARFLGLGLLLALLGIIGWGVVPLGRYIHWLATNPAMVDSRARPVAATLILALALLAGVGFWSVDEHTRAEAVIENPLQVQLVAACDGVVEQVLAADGQEVAAGQTLLHAANPALRAQRQDIEAQRVELTVSLAEGTINDPARVRVIKARIEALQKQIDEIDRQMSELDLKSPLAGRLVAPNLESLPGRYVKRGEALGLVRPATELYATAVIDQTQNALFFAEGTVRRVELRTSGRPERTIEGRIAAVVPAAQADLPHAALGATAGGVVLTKRDDKTGKAAAESFFEVKVALGRPTDLSPGQRAIARFTLRPRPLAAQWWRKLLRLARVRNF